MHLESLRIFRDLIETGTFSKAAELNYLTQSAVSQQLKNLEKSVGQPLLDRASRRIKLTPAGRLFYRTAKRIVTSYEDMNARIHSISPESTQRLRIAAIYSVGTYVLQRYLKEFLKTHPGVKVDIDYQKASRICDDILRGRADLSIMAYPVKRRDLAVIPLDDEELVLILPPRHLLCRRPKLRLADLAGQDFIAFDRGTPTRKAIDKVLRERGVRPKIRMELDNIETIKSAVSSGMGLAIVPEPTVAAEHKSNRLCLRRFSDQKLSRPLGVLVRKVRREDKAVRAFLQHLGAPGAN
ncbi:MAG TPA: LysR family transcriptional regulator [Elusimicrobia bacterium]|nr:LysR family transcriptional regulator [Elusimicrobiota bacterium]HBT61514.1 LysR family transcriptional regulator [Elusimicrobiota bacterium]